MSDDNWALYKFLPNPLRQYELDIDLKILRAARHGLPLTYTCYQTMRELVLGQKLNIRCRFDPQAKKFEQEIAGLR